MSLLDVSLKEKILIQIENAIKSISTNRIAYDDVYFNNDVGYVDRQYDNITQDDIKQNGKNWIIINEKKHVWKPLVGGDYENKLSLQIVAYTQVENRNENLSSVMNSLQKDIFVAMLKDKELCNSCSYIVPVSDYPVENMIYPYGGYISNYEITYVTKGLEF